MLLDLTDYKSTLVQVMAWCHQATSHYLSQCWPRSLSPYGVTRPQWVNTLRSEQNGQHFADNIFNCIFLRESLCILTPIALKFVPNWRYVGLCQHWFRHMCQAINWINDDLVYWCYVASQCWFFWKDYFKYIFMLLVFVTKIINCKIENLIYDKSILDQVLVCYSQATSHYLIQNWLRIRSKMPYNSCAITRLQLGLVNGRSLEGLRRYC